MSALVRPHRDGAIVAVRVVPGAARAGVVGVHGDELKVRVCSPPVDGRANVELCAIVARVLGVKPRDVRVVAGQTARSKQVLVTASYDEVVRRVDEAIGGSAGPER